jgi:hypothetical protein
MIGVVGRMVRKYKLTFIGILAGGLIGFLYYYFIGCSNGSCIISSRPLNSTLYGALVGGLLLHGTRKNNQKPINDNANEP